MASKKKERASRKAVSAPSSSAEKTSERQRAPIPIVALGASAGGLGALDAFFTAMPPDSGMAFVVITHLHPDSPSLLADLLARRTAMRVVEVKERTLARADHVYTARPGMQLSILPHVFEILHQDSREPVARDGLGLGLYIVRQLVELHRGVVEAASPGIGEGAVFTLRFPAQGVPAPASSNRVLGRPAHEDLSGVNVLLVEDDEDTTELVSKFLTDCGAKVASAPDVDSALSLFESVKPDVLVSDIALVGDDGCALVRELRRKDENLVAIAMSGFTTERDAARALEAGFNAHLTKPLAPARLIEEIRTQLTAKRT